MAGNKRERELARLRAERKQQREEEKHRRRIRNRAAVGALVAALLVIGGVAFAVSGDDTPSTSASPTPTDAADAEPAEPVAKKCKKASGKEPSTDRFGEYQSVVQEGSRYTLALETNCGPIEIALDSENAPETTDALTFLADRQFYDRSVCHRLTRTNIYVLQCGDPRGTGAGGPGFTVPDENLPELNDEGLADYPRGTVAMANSGPDTNGSQFFIVYEDTQLPPAYTVAGEVTKGMEVVDAVADAGIVDDKNDGKPKQALELKKVQSSVTRKVS